MLTLFKPLPVYIKLFSNKIEVTDLNTGNSLIKVAVDQFSNERLVIANFQNADTLLRSALKELLKLRSFLQPSLKVVIQQMEKLEEGLSQVEIRALRDIAEMAGASHVKVIEHAKSLSQYEALLEIAAIRN
jgi:hypothetical protein